MLTQIWRRSAGGVRRRATASRWCRRRVRKTHFADHGCLLDYMSSRRMALRTVLVSVHLLLLPFGCAHVPEPRSQDGRTASRSSNALERDNVSIVLSALRGAYVPSKQAPCAAIPQRGRQRRSTHRFGRSPGARIPRSERCVSRHPPWNETVSEVRFRDELFCAFSCRSPALEVSSHCT